MANDILEILAMPFMQRAFAAGVLVAIMSAFLGPFIVQRKMSFLGDGLAHAAFGGVALGLLLGFEPIYIAIPFTLLTSLGITWIKDRTSIEQDTSIGIFFAVSVALGVVFLALKDSYTVDAYAYLFGSILSISSSDVLVSLFMTIITLLAMLRYWKIWAYSTFDRELAIVDKVKVVRADMMLSALISLVIVLSVKLVGIVLIASFLIIPSASAKLISRTFTQMTIYSLIIGIVGAVLGLLLSLILDMPSGAIIILVHSTFFFILSIIHIISGKN